MGLKGCSKQSFTIRRQHPVGPYILDFYCDKAKLAIEIDGSVHNDDERMRRDAVRDAWLSQRGVETLRFAHEDVMTHGEDIAAEIVGLIGKRLGLPPIE